MHQAPVMKRASAEDGKVQLCANPWGQPQDKLWITFKASPNVDKSPPCPRLLPRLSQLFPKVFHTLCPS